MASKHTAPPQKSSRTKKVTTVATVAAEDSPSKKRKESSEPTTPRNDKKKVQRKEKDVLPAIVVSTPQPLQPDTPIPSSEGRPRFKRSNTLSKMGGALKRGLSKTFSKKKVTSSSSMTASAPVEEEKSRRKTANVHDLLQTANAQLSGRYWRAPLDAVGVMALYDKLLQWMTQHALQIEGIFRKSPQNAQFVRLRNFIESKGLTGDIPADTDPYLVANLIKTLMGELPGSILTRSAFGLFADAAGTGDDDDAAFAAELRTLIDTHLPKRNQRLLADIFALCRTISTVYVDETKMTSSNLATCISPNFVTPLEELFNANQSSLLQAYKLFHRTTRVLIEFYDLVFEPAADSFAAHLLKAHNVPRRASIVVDVTENNNNNNNDEDTIGDDEDDEEEAVVVVAEDIAADEVAVEADAPDDGSCFDTSLPLDFATPLERLAAFKRTATNKTFLYVDDEASQHATKNARLTSLLERLSVSADVEWHAELHGGMTVDEALGEVLQNRALSIKRIVASTDDAIEQIDLDASPTREELVNAITYASDRSAVATPLLAYNGTLFVGFNEQIWSMKLEKH